MRILHVLSQTQVTGAEVYTATLADWFINHGHEVFIVSDTFRTPTKAKIFSQPISKRDWFQRLHNERFLRLFIQDNKIDIVHAHSRAASWISYFACRNEPVLYISTVHGRQHLHLSTKLLDVYGDKVIAVCENLRQHLIEEVGMRPGKISVLHNGFAFPIKKIIKMVSEQKKTLSFIGRLSGYKGERLCEMITGNFESILQQNPDINLEIFGGDENQLDGNARSKVRSLNESYGNKIQFRGFVGSIHEIIQNSDLIIGAGRVAIESVYYGIPTIAYGESEYIGLVDGTNIANCIASNFGDIAVRDTVIKPHHEQLLTDIKKGFASLPFSFSSEMKNLYDIEHNAEIISELYKTERMRKLHPKYIPILMYHRVPINPIDSRHKTYVTKERLEKQFRFFRMRGLQPITFKEYRQFRDAERSINLLPKKPIILTFDDGYADNYENLFPLLKKYAATCVLFAIADPAMKQNTWDEHVNGSNNTLMSPEQLREFHDYGIEIGAHTVTHSDLTELEEVLAKGEIVQSKRWLETFLNTEVVSFAYPYGKFNPAVKEQVREAGYTFSVATDNGGMTIEQDRYEIFRVNMFPDESLFSLFKKTSHWYRRYYLMKRGK